MVWVSQAWPGKTKVCRCPLVVGDESRGEALKTEAQAAGECHEVTLLGWDVGECGGLNMLGPGNDTMRRCVLVGGSRCRS